MKTKLIPLTRGFSAIVNASDYDDLVKFKWCALGKSGTQCYAVRREWSGPYKQKTIFMHRQIMGEPSFPEADIDHINGKKFDNRRENLRWCSRAQNKVNTPKSLKTRNKYKGVYKKKYGFQVLVRVNKKLLHMGFFKCELEAALAYNEAVIKHHGEFAFLNAI